MATLAQESKDWVDSVEYAQDIKDRFDSLVNSDLQLQGHRDHIEASGLGFGERCFHWLWKLLIDEMPSPFSFLEIGVYKGQVLSLVRLLADRTDRRSHVVGVTPLSKTSGTGQFPDFDDADFGKCIEDLHDRYDLKQPRLIVGDSTSAAVQWEVMEAGPYDIIYIDGCHELEYVTKDLMFYPQLLNTGGFLVIDDASWYLKMPRGFFRGIVPVSRAVGSIIETDSHWDHLLAVVHNRVWQRLPIPVQWDWGRKT